MKIVTSWNLVSTMNRIEFTGQNGLMASIISLKNNANEINIT